MYLRTIQRRNKNGSVVRYLQLAHNEWDPATKMSRPKVLHNLGREDELDRAGLERFARSIIHYLEQHPPD